MANVLKVVVIDLATSEGRAAYAEYMRPKNEADWWRTWDAVWWQAWDMVRVRRAYRDKLTALGCPGTAPLLPVGGAR